MGATYRERLVELRRELLAIHRRLKAEDGAQWLGIAANEVADALKQIPRAVLRLPAEPTDLAGIVAKHFPEEGSAGHGAQGDPATPIADCGHETLAPPPPPVPPITAMALPPAPRKPCKVCGATDHDARRHNGRTREQRAAPAPVAPPASDAEEPEPAGLRPLDEEPDPAVKHEWSVCEKAHVARLARAPQRCRRCHQPGHRSDTCDLDLTAARLQDIEAAAVRLGLAPPPEPRSPLPTVAAPIAAPARTAWNRDDPDEDLTDLDLGVAEPEAPPVLDGPMLVTPPPPVELATGHEPTPAQARIRAKLRVLDNGRVRAKTVAIPANGRLHMNEREVPDDLLDPSAYDRPATRGECEGQPRPCPWVSCVHHLALDVNESTGSFKLNFPHLEVWEMPTTCSLDVADRGGITLEEVGAILNLTRERIRQVEVRGLDKIRRHEEDLEDVGDRRGSPLALAIDES